MFVTVNLSRCQVRDDELDELDELIDTMCEVPPCGGSENTYGKVNILLQTYISRGNVKSFSLTSDLMYIAQVGIRHFNLAKLQASSYLFTS